MTRPRLHSARKRRPSVSIRADVYDQLRAVTDKPSATVEQLLVTWLDGEEEKTS